jgi:hypothetical protein
MITLGDEFPIHQTPEPVQQVFTSDRNFYDRFFFNGYWRDGEPFFEAALGLYPNLGIIDAAFGVVYAGTQHCLRASRELGPERMATRVGPIAVEIVEPLRRLRIRVEHDEIRADLQFEGRAAPIEEPRFTRRSGPRLVQDLTRFTQHGGYSGTLAVGGKTFEASPSRTWGCRDRSWGIRRLGPRDPAGIPRKEPVQFFWLWSPANFEDLCTHFCVDEKADGSRWHEFGAIVPAEFTARPEPATAVDWSLEYAPGTRHARRAEIWLKTRSGETRIDLHPLYNFYMQGLGYGHPKWGHGMYLGPSAFAYESFRLADVDETQPIAQHVHALCEARAGERRGMGILEMLILGPHERSGFREFLDMHP